MSSSSQRGRQGSRRGDEAPNGDTQRQSMRAADLAAAADLEAEEFAKKGDFQQSFWNELKSLQASQEQSARMLAELARLVQAQIAGSERHESILEAQHSELKKQEADLAAIAAGMDELRSEVRQMKLDGLVGASPSGQGHESANIHELARLVRETLEQEGEVTLRPADLARGRSTTTRDRAVVSQPTGQAPATPLARSRSMSPAPTSPTSKVPTGSSSYPLASTRIVPTKHAGAEGAAGAASANATWMPNSQRSEATELVVAAQAKDPPLAFEPIGSSAAAQRKGPKTSRSSLLFSSISKGDEAEAFSILRQASSAVNARDEMECSALHLAAARGLENLVRALLADAHFQEVNSLDCYRRTAFHHAAIGGHVEVAQIMLKDLRFEKIEAWALHGRTALHYAAECGHSEVCLALLAHQRFAAEEAKDTFEHTALHFGARSGHGRVCEVLLGHGANGNATDTDAWNAIHFAGSGGHVDVTAALLRSPRFTEVNAQTASGRTALHFAAAYGHLKVCELLMENSRFTAFQAKELDTGFTAVEVAAQAGKKEVQKYINRHPRMKDSRIRQQAHLYEEDASTQAEVLMYGAAIASFKAYMRGIPVRDVWEDAHAEAGRYWETRLLYGEKRDTEAVFTEAEDSMERACDGWSQLTALTLSQGLARAVTRIERVPRLKALLSKATNDAMKERLASEKMVLLPHRSTDQKLIKACEEEAVDSALQVLRGRGVLSLDDDDDDEGGATIYTTEHKGGVHQEIPSLVAYFVDPNFPSGRQGPYVIVDSP